MSKSVINVGNFANDASGDPLRTAGIKINDNFSEIYSTFGDGSNLNPTVNLAINANYANTSGISSNAVNLIYEPSIVVESVTSTGIITASNYDSPGTSGSFTSVGVATISSELQSFYYVQHSSTMNIDISDFTPNRRFEVICRNTSGSAQTVVIRTSQTDSGHVTVPFLFGFNSTTVTNGNLSISASRGSRITLYNDLNGDIFGVVD